MTDFHPRGLLISSQIPRPRVLYPNTTCVTICRKFGFEADGRGSAKGMFTRVAKEPFWFTAGCTLPTTNATGKRHPKGHVETNYMDDLLVWDEGLDLKPGIFRPTHCMFAGTRSTPLHVFGQVKATKGL